MGAIKTLLIVIFLTPIFTFGQNSIYPKDTIYVKYEKKTGNKKLSNWKYKNKDGISFSIKDISGKHISLFYEQINKTDTLCMKHIKEYKFLNLKSIYRDDIHVITILKEKRQSFCDTSKSALLKVDAHIFKLYLDLCVF